MRFVRNNWMVITCLTVLLLAYQSAIAQTDSDLPYSSPCALAASPDGSVLYAAEETAKRIACIDLSTGTIQFRIALPGHPTGLAVSPKHTHLYVTGGIPSGRVWIVDLTSRKTIEIKTGFGACSPVVSSDDKRLYVCNRYDNDVSVIDLRHRKEIARISTSREPVASALTSDGETLAVVHLLPAGRSDTDFTAAEVTLIDTEKLRAVESIPLPNGSTSAYGICISPDNRYTFVTHLLSRYQMPTFQLDRGWMNTNALSVVDLKNRSLLNTVLLDDVDRGAADPWGVAMTKDGRFLCVAHAGTHELSVIDAPALLGKLESMPSSPKPVPSGNYPAASLTARDVPNDLSFLVAFRRRISLPGTAPRALTIVGQKAYTANYFSDDINTVSFDNTRKNAIETIALGPKPELTVTRRGEMIFHDARMCFQQWQSCSSCHPDGRVDGLNWDLLNDGIGNPKNTKSMLLSHQTPPAMSTGIRPDAETAVRSGFRHILFLQHTEEDAEAVDEYLKSMKPISRPAKNTKAIERGRELFFSQETACAFCHQGEYYTDMKSYDVGTRGELDRRDDFDTPTLIELWRSAPYLHDGRAATIRNVLTTDNPKDKHGKTSHLTPEQISDLVQFLKSL